MCSRPEQSKSNSSASQEALSLNMMSDLNKLCVETEDFVQILLELASSDDVEGLKRSVGSNAFAVNSTGLWYVRNKGSKQITKEERTPLMVAASYGSINFVKFLVALPGVEMNKTCGQDKWTALHCATSGGSVKALDVVKILLSAGCNPSIRDVSGRRPIDVIVVPSKLPGSRTALEDLLYNFSDGSMDDFKLCVSLSGNTASSLGLASSPEAKSHYSPSASDCLTSPMAPKSGFSSFNSLSEKKQYPIDPYFPDIRDGVYASDEFRMYSLKVRPCSRAYSHDWTECPFAHPGENARRRDPRKYHYSCVPCPEFRKGSCRLGDMCEYAHGVFECWLHPAQYRTRLCKDGKSCARQVCFFAHTQEELRPLYASTGSGVPSPRATASVPSYMDMAAALNHFPGSPTSQSVMSPAFNQAMSPTANGMSHSTAAWPHTNVPALQLPNSNLHSSRLRSSLNARDIPPEDFHLLSDYNTQKLILSSKEHFTPQRSDSALSFSRSMTIPTPSNLDELFSGEIVSSPRYSDQSAAFGVFSPTHKSAVLNQFHPQQSLLSPINTSNNYAARNSLLQASFGPSSPRMSPRSVESASPRGAYFAALAQQERHQQQFRSLSSRDLGAHVSTNMYPNTGWSNLGAQNGELDWQSRANDQQQQQHHKRSSSLELKTDGEEPDLSWVQSLVKESPPEMMVKAAARVSSAAPGECSQPTPQLDSIDHSVLGDWIEQMQLDQLTA